MVTAGLALYVVVGAPGGDDLARVASRVGDSPRRS